LSKRRLWLLLLFLGLLLLVAACADQDQETPISPLSVPDTNTASPIPTATPAASLAEPTAGPEAVPTSDPALGTVEGTLLIDDQPPVEDTLYLAPIVSSGEGIGVASLDAARDPRAFPDASGNFTFYNVPPGRYSLAIVSPVGPVLIRDPDDTEITVEVEAGEITDLGTISIPSFE
jgi:hypothetical protein